MFANIYSHSLDDLFILLIVSFSVQKLFSLSEWKSFNRVQLCDPMDYAVQGMLQARILVWVAFPFSSGSSHPRDRTQVSCIAGKFFTSWATWGALYVWVILIIFVFVSLLWGDLAKKKKKKKLIRPLSKSVLLSSRNLMFRLHLSL